MTTIYTRAYMQKYEIIVWFVIIVWNVKNGEKLYYKIIITFQIRENFSETSFLLLF